MQTILFETHLISTIFQKGGLSPRSFERGDAASFPEQFFKAKGGENMSNFEKGFDPEIVMGDEGGFNFRPAPLTPREAPEFYGGSKSDNISSRATSYEEATAEVYSLTVEGPVDNPHILHEAVEVRVAVMRDRESIKPHTSSIMPEGGLSNGARMRAPVEPRHTNSAHTIGGTRRGVFRHAQRG